MLQLLQRIDGAKTYGCSVLLALLAACDLAGIVPAEARAAVYSSVAAGLAASLRHALSKMPAETSQRIARAADVLRKITEALKTPVAPLPEPNEASPLARLAVLFVPLLLLSSAPLFASPPRAIIDGPASVRAPGQKLVLRAADSTQKSAKGYRWTIHPEIRGYEQMTVIDGGRAVLIHTLPGRYVVTLTVAGAPSADGEVEIDSITHTLEIPGNAPCPPPEPVPDPLGPLPEPPQPTPPPTPKPPAPQPTPPQPQPTPTPPQPLPAGDYNISPRFSEIARAVEDPQKATSVKRMADSLDAIAAQVAAGTLTKFPETFAQVQTVLQALSEHWQEPRSDARAQMSGVLSLVYQQHKNGRLALLSSGEFKNASSWAQLLRECSLGIRHGV